MTRAEVVEILRKLADELERGDAPAAEVLVLPTTRSRRRPAAAESSTRPVNEVARQKARNILRKKGIAFE